MSNFTKPDPTRVEEVVPGATALEKMRLLAKDIYKSTPTLEKGIYHLFISDINLDMPS